MVRPRRPGYSKYRAILTEIDGIKFASRKEASYYCDLKLRGDVLYFLRQVPIHLPGNVRYVIDFLEFHMDGTVHYVDVKGFETTVFKLKKKQAEALYPIKIEVV